MTPEAKERIIRFGSTLSGPVRIKLFPSDDGPGRAFSSFCSELSRLAPKIEVKEAGSFDKKGPAIEVAPRLVYQTLPLGEELEPFLALLAAVSSPPSGPLPPQIHEAVAEISIPAALAVYISPRCPFCPTAVRQITPLALACEFISVTVIDALMFPDDAESHDIRSTPTVIMEGNLRWSGKVDFTEIVRMIIDRDPGTLAMSSMINMIENGDAGRLARMMLDARKIFPAFVDLLVHEKWPVRLGAMVAMETITQEDAALAAHATGFLWHRFHEAADAVQGDILYIFGEIGHGEAVKKLREVLSGAYSDEVKEAATEALDNLPVG